MKIKKIILILICIVTMFSTCLSINIFAEKNPDLIITKDSETQFQYYKDRPDLHNSNPIDNLSVTYDDSSNTYIVTLSGDVTLNPVDDPAIGSNSSNIKVNGEGCLTINYSLTKNGVIKHEQGVAAHPYSMIHTTNPDVALTEIFFTLTLGDEKENKNDNNKLTLNLNTIRSQEVEEYFALEESPSDEAMMECLSSDNIIINGVDLNVNGSGYLIHSRKIIEMNDCNNVINYSQGYSNRLFFLYSQNESICFNRSTLNMDVDDIPELYFAMPFYGPSEVKIIDSKANAKVPVFIDEPVSLLYGKNIIVSNSDCYLSGSFAAVLASNLEINNSNFGFVGGYLSVVLMPENTEEGLTINEDITHGGYFETIMNPGDLGPEYSLITIVSDSPKIDINMDSNVSIYAGSDKDNVKPYDSLEDVIKDKCCYIFFERQYSITIMDGDIEYTDITIDVPLSGIIERPEDPIKEGYKFVGYYCDKELTIPFDFNNIVTEDTTIYLKWKKVEEEKKEEKSDNIHNNHIYNVPKTGIR